MSKAGPELLSQLARQLDFLRRSSAAYDAGFLDEALRCAVVLRVLFHTTGRQSSLIRLLGLEGIKILSTCRKYVRPAGTPTRVKGTLFKVTSGIFLGIAPVEVGPIGARHYAPLDAHEVEIWMPVMDWWNQVVFDFPGFPAISRKKVVTSGANKEGAHVDPILTAEYVALKVSPNLSYGADKFAEPLKNAHLPALRQISYEVLKSPDITSLVEPRAS